MITRRRRQFRPPSCDAFTLVEAILCMLIVSVTLVAALQATSASGVVQFKAADRARGRALATSLMNEILQQRYAAPPPSGGAESGQSSGLGGLLGGVLNVVGVVLGADGGGSGAAQPGNRLAFDDVDDFAGYSESPPLNRDGSPIPGATAYRRQVIVVSVNPANLSVTTASDSGAKSITVLVTRNGLTVARLVCVKTNVE